MEVSKYNQKDVYVGLQFLIVMPHKQLLVSTVISSNVVTQGALTHGLMWERNETRNRPASQQHILRKHYRHCVISLSDSAADSFLQMNKKNTNIKIS